MAFALGMDAFSVGLGMGMAKLRNSQMLQIGVIIGLFHVIMPLFGMMAGQFFPGALGALAGYINIACKRAKRTGEKLSRHHSE